MHDLRGTSVVRRGMRLHRLLKLLALLRGPSAWTTRRLGEHFEMSPRNVSRDIEVLRLAGVPIYFDSEFGEHGGYRVRPGFYFPAIGLDDNECLDLAVLARAAESRSIPLLEGACSVRDKILSTLPAKKQDLVCAASELFDVLSFGLADHSHCRGVMVQLQNALLANQQLSGTYRSPHQNKTVKVSLQPRRLFLGGGPAWYLAAIDNDDDVTKLYRVARFKSASVSKKTNTVDPNFSIREFLGNAWGVMKGDRDWHIEIEFDREAAPLVEEVQWHHTQELERRRGGKLIFRATVSGLDEVQWWVLQWGPRAVVRKPVELCQIVSELGAAVAQRYRKSRSTRRSS